jgi:hypothetical protein
MFLYSRNVFYVCKNFCTFIPLVMFQDSIKNKVWFDVEFFKRESLCLLLLGFPGVSPLEVYTRFIAVSFQFYSKIAEFYNKMKKIKSVQPQSINCGAA